MFQAAHLLSCPMPAGILRKWLFERINTFKVQGGEVTVMIVTIDWLKGLTNSKLIN